MVVAALLTKSGHWSWANGNGNGWVWEGFGGLGWVCTATTTCTPCYYDDDYYNWEGFGGFGWFWAGLVSALGHTKISILGGERAK